MELCHSMVETSVGWFKEQQNKPAEDREATSSHLMVEEQPLAQVALNSYFPTDVGHGESRACSLQGLKLCCLRKKAARKNCAGSSLWCREKPAWESWARSAAFLPTKWSVSCTARTRCSHLQNASATTSSLAASPNA